MTETETTEDPPGKDEQLAERHGFVDFDKIEDPEVRKQVQDRIHGLYQSQKDTAAAMAEARRMYSAMEKRVTEVESKESQKTSEAKLEQIRTGIVEANSKGDYETATKLNEQLIDAKAPKPEEKPAPTNSGLEREHEAMLMNWQSEMTDDGRIARPWAHPRNGRYQDTIALLNEVTNDPAVAGKGFQAILTEVDRRMTPKPKQASPVADGDTTPARTNGRDPQLTAPEKNAATRLYPNMKPAEAIKRYAEAKKKYGDQ